MAGKVSKPAGAVAFTHAKYRLLPLGQTWVSTEDSWALKEEHEPSLIDRLVLNGASTGQMVVVNGLELGELAEGALPLEKPERSGDLRIVSEKRPYGLELYGLEARELTEHEGFKRHLEFVR